MKQLQTILCSIGLLISASVNSATLVDTGAPISTVGYSMGPGQYLSGKFSLDSKTTLTDIEGWMKTGGIHILSVYTDGGDVPGATLLYTDTYQSSSLDIGWMGLYGISWELDAGDYWVSFEGEGASGAMPYPAPSPLTNYAFNAQDQFGDYQGWIPHNLGIGIRISGEVSAVPIPAAAWLFGSGLIGLIGIARRRKQS